MKKLSFILSIVGLQLCTSCNNWLDVTPQGQIEAEKKLIGKELILIPVSYTHLTLPTT